MMLKHTPAPKLVAGPNAILALALKAFAAQLGVDNLVLVIGNRLELGNLLRLVPEQLQLAPLLADLNDLRVLLSTVRGAGGQVAGQPMMTTKKLRQSEWQGGLLGQQAKERYSRLCGNPPREIQGAAGQADDKAKPFAAA